MEINYKELIKQSHSYRKREYIKYFFENIVGTDQEPIYAKDSDEQFGNYFDISIVKNYQEKKSKYGKVYVGKYWRTCLFYFVDRKDACEYLNSFGKDNYSFEKENIYWETSNGFAGRTFESSNADRINNNVFHYFKRKRSSWFVRSFVYFILVICDETTPISSKDFIIHYWNSKYEFKKAGKSMLFGKSKIISFVQDVPTELSLINDENKESIDCVKAYLGELDFYNENEEAFTDIKSDIDSGVPYILCKGAARTGKTVLALRFLHEYPNFKLLLMNYSFYVSLKDAFGVVNCPFPTNRIFHHDLNHKSSGCWVRGVATKTLNYDISRLIVDEAQRLGSIEETYSFRGAYLSGFDSIDTIVNCDNHVQTLFFGDDSQRLNSKYDKGMEEIKKAIGDRDYREYYFSSPLGVPLELLKNIRFLLGYENSSPNTLNSFSISIEKEPAIFAQKYLCDDQKKKHLVVPVIENVNLNELKIDNISFKNIKSLNIGRYLFNKDVQDNYFLTAYSVISREIESVYLYIPNYIYLDEEEAIQSRNSHNNIFLINHLYTIMTRATMSLTICCEDDKLGEYFNDRIEAIKKEPPTIYDENLIPEYDYDIFIAYFGTNRLEGTYSIAKELCDGLKEQGLVVFLNGYSTIESDNNLRFTETWHALHRSKTMMFVFNEFVDKDSSGLILRTCSDGSTSNIYQELLEFQTMIDDGFRRAKTDVRFFYSGNRLTKYNVYPFLNKYYSPLTQGNSDCCFMNKDEMNNWVKWRFFEEKDNND